MTLLATNNVEEQVEGWSTSTNAYNVAQSVDGSYGKSKLRMDDRGLKRIKHHYKQLS